MSKDKIEIVECGPFGGKGGSMFTDQAQAYHGDITKIKIKAGQVCVG